MFVPLSRRIPREVYLDNAKQFIAEEFKAELAKHHIKPIYGKPYHPRGRGKNRELPQSSLQRVDHTGQVHFSFSFQERASKV